jgi:S1-C subfamily serine protease
MSLKRLFSLLACLASFCQLAEAETIYRWTDKDGSVRFTRSKPSLGIAYETFEVPDPIKWLNAPDMPAEIGAAGESKTQNVFKAVSKSVYGLTGGRQDDSGQSRRVVFGSAVAVTNRLAITNCHVLEGAGEDIYLGAGGTEETERAKLVGADYEADRCVISVSRMDLHPVPGIRRFEVLEVGETVYAIGNPLKLDRSLSEGLLSGKREAGDRRYLQTTAPISPGSSGGGLFDAHGNLIGITSFTLKGAQSLNFAIPAEDYWK